TYLSREKRFFIHTNIGTAHCPNTGSMKSIIDRPIARIWLSDHGPDDTRPTTRKLRYTAEIAEFPDGTLAVINTARANDLAKEALTHRQTPSLASYSNVKMEAKWDAETRFDALLTQDQKRCWVEVKSSTLQLESNIASFPDSVSTRGQKHLQVLMQAVAQGDAAVQLYLVMRTGSSYFSPAAHIDATYATLLAQAQAAGVQVLCHEAAFTRDANGTPTEITLGKPLKVVL
ncbi:MAG: DNA/RNA nuclease SfsA, partial [Alphaproteobacteria bacterium]